MEGVQNITLGGNLINMGRELGKVVVVGIIRVFLEREGVKVTGRGLNLNFFFF
jgi:hypothetical protein